MINVFLLLIKRKNPFLFSFWIDRFPQILYYHIIITLLTFEVSVLQKCKLSNSEELLLHIFWRYSEPLSAQDIFQISQQSPDTLSWSINYIHKMLSALLDKHIIEICDFAKEGRKYVRKFKPTLSKEVFFANMLEQQGVNTASFAKIAVALVKKKNEKEGSKKHDQLIAELEHMINEFEKSENEET